MPFGSRRHLEIPVSLGEIEQSLAEKGHLTMKPFSSVVALLLFSGICAGISFVNWQATPAWAWENGTHKEFSKRAAKYVSQEGLSARLTTDYALTNGVDQILNVKWGDKPRSVMGWIIEGADSEDAPDCRVFAHWHDPLMPIGNEGFQPYLANPVFRGPSARKWGFGVDARKQSEKDGFVPESFPAFGCNQNLDNMSWNDARSDFEKALTEPLQSDREEAFARMFKAIGHVMHLIQDNANPAHARNDNHLDVLGALNLDLTGYGLSGFPDPDNFHKYVQLHKVAEIFDLNHDKIKSYTQKAETLLGTKSAGGSMPPPGNLIDSDQYTGANPEVTTSGVTGTAEFANANFFSDDTTPDVLAGRTYPHPQLGELSGGFPLYWSLQRGTHLNLQHALKNDIGSAILTIAYPQYCLGLQALGQSCAFRLDDAIFDDYFKELGPRAVAYSAALLQYFFRGQLSAETETRTESVLLWITNKSAQPLMDGSFSIYTDSETGERTQRGEKYNLASYGLSTMLNPGQRLLYPIEIPRQTLGDAEVIHIVYEGGLGTTANLEPDAVIGLMNVSLSETCSPSSNIEIGGGVRVGSLSEGQGARISSSVSLSLSNGGATASAQGTGESATVAASGFSPEDYAPTRDYDNGQAGAFIGFNQFFKITSPGKSGQSGTAIITPQVSASVSVTCAEGDESGAYAAAYAVVNGYIDNNAGGNVADYAGYGDIKGCGAIGGIFPIVTSSATNFSYGAVEYFTGGVTAFTQKRSGTLPGTNAQATASLQGFTIKVQNDPDAKVTWLCGAPQP